jgi:hypothetical protein
VRLGRLVLAIGLILCGASIGSSRDPEAPRPKVQLSNERLADFQARISSYLELRRELEQGLTIRTVAEDSAAIRATSRALAAKIREARQKARRGEFFTPAISAEFKRVLFLEMTASAWAAIQADNPGQISIRINGAYPEGKPVSTMPAGILAALPTLPLDVEYRFVGRHLILLDTSASVILDEIPYAIQRPRADL